MRKKDLARKKKLNRQLMTTVIAMFIAMDLHVAWAWIVFIPCTIYILLWTNANRP